MNSLLRKNDVLNSIRIASPCHASWEGMTGDERVRHCCDCRLNVYNIAEMSRDEAVRLIQESEGRLCVRLYQRRDGTVITRDCPKGLWWARRKAALAVACSAGLFISLAALAVGATVRDEDSAWSSIRIHDASWRQKLPTLLRDLIDRIDPLPAVVAGNMPSPTVQGMVVMGSPAPAPSQQNKTK